MPDQTEQSPADLEDPGQQDQAEQQKQDRAAEALTKAASADDEAEKMEQTMAAAAAMAEKTGGLGKPGRPINRRSPFFIGMMAAAGVAVTYALAELLIRARSELILIGLALFIAAGLDPIVSWLTRRGVPRGLAVLIILLGVAGILGGFFAAAIPPISNQAAALVHQLPHYLKELKNHNSELGKLNAQFHVQKRISDLLSNKGSKLVGGVLGAGEVVLGAATSFFVVIVLTVYFLAALPRVKIFAYRLAPQSRRTRVILLGDEIFAKVGGYVLGNFLTSVIAGVGTWIWLVSWRVPYPVLLALLVALLDLIPVIGSTVGGIIVALLAWTDSGLIAVATLGFYVFYRLAEDYFIVPRIMGRTVEVPAIVTILAVLVGGALEGIIGALVAIPIAAALRLLLREVVFRRLDDS